MHDPLVTTLVPVEDDDYHPDLNTEVVSAEVHDDWGDGANKGNGL